MGTAEQLGVANAVLIRSAGLGALPLGTPPSPVGRFGGYAAKPLERVRRAKAVKQH
jgi:hypothetical protein